MWNSDIEESVSDAERSSRRSQRIQEMKRKKQRQEMLRRLAVPIGAGLLVCIVLIIVGVRAFAVRARRRENPNNTRIEQTAPPQTEQQTSNASERETEQQTSSTSEESSEQQTSSASEEEPEQQTSNAPEEESERQESSGLTKTDASQQTEATDAEHYAAKDMQSASVGGLIGQAGTNSAEGLRAGHGSGLGWTAVESTPLSAEATGQTIVLGDEMFSENVVFINASEGTVLAQKGAWTTIPPASMTKILTVLVAAEHVTDIEDTYTMTRTAAEYGLLHDCTGVGFVEGEEVSLRDLFYGTALKSGADAAVGLAEYVAGSHEAFVDLMNEKLEQLGVSDSAHFANCVGNYDPNHYCTVYDMAVILKAAYDNPFCREVLSAHVYTIERTTQYPEGIQISNWFLRRIEDKDTHGEVLCAKTGYVDASEHCAASLLVGSDGTVYICATVHAPTVWRCIEDHTALYQRFVP